MIDVCRLRSAWCLLSIRQTEVFWDVLELDAIGEAPSFRWVKKMMLEACVSGKIQSDFHSVHKILLRSIAAKLGEEVSKRLDAWFDGVFVEGGPDRADQNLWMTLIASGFDIESSDSGIVASRIRIRERFIEITEGMKRRFSGLLVDDNYDIDEMRLLDACYWSVEGFATTVELISNLNIFVNLWNEEYKNAGEDYMEKFRDCCAPVAPLFGASSDSLPVPPSRWSRTAQANQ